jgi:hypothetical protein
VATEKERNIQKINFRLHTNDKLLFTKYLEDANLTYQAFMDACMQAFLRGDPAIMKVIKDWRVLNEIPKEHLERYTLSHRERAEIAKELEQIESEQDIDPRRQKSEG